MAFLTKSASMLLLVAFCFLFLMQLFQSSDCYVVCGCFRMTASMEGVQQQHRKLLSSLKGNEMVFKSGVAEAANNGEGKNMDGWELREAPLGPDPLHHHGGSPKKPRTP